MIIVSRWNSPDDGPFQMFGRKSAFAKFTWDPGDTYDATNHANAKPFANGATSGGEVAKRAGANPYDLWGISHIEDILWDSQGSSSSDAAGGALIPTWNRNGQYISLFRYCPQGSSASLVAVDPTELVTGKILTPLVFYGIVMGS